METLIHSPDGELKTTDPFQQIGNKFYYGEEVCAVTAESIRRTKKRFGSFDTSFVFLYFTKQREIHYARRRTFIPVEDDY